MRIGELARRVGLRPSAIRYYESLGLLAPPRRIHGRRDYGPEAAARLQLVQAAQFAGFTLEEIRIALDRLASAPNAGDKWVALARSKLEELDREIARLETARSALVDAFECRCGGVPEACTLVAHARADR